MYRGILRKELKREEEILFNQHCNLIKIQMEIIVKIQTASVG
jgi:hypothetical protein